MKYKNFPNPYDFANPVTEEQLFAGRSGELKDIRYYLKQGTRVKKPINLSLIGARAAGKTSLLNMIEIEAKKMDYLTVRIDLDEGDKENQITFFYKIFDSIINAAIDKGCFGGYSGAIYDEYLNQTSAYSISSDIALKPFLFPIQYAKAMELGRANVNTSEANFKRDLEVVRNEFGGSIILLFDECNVLSESRILLEKIRNIFMNKENYMLVFTGTNDLFPVIDDIFSPIIRQFKKINVCKFEDEKDTETCVNKPLQAIGLEPDEVFESNTYKELHSISEGKPYEIQLVCHNMFAKLQEGKHEKMVLNHSVLEDVRNELETSQDFTKRPRLYDIKCLDEEGLSHLNYLCRSLKKAKPENILTLEYITNIEDRVTKDAFKESLNIFINKGILVIDDNGFIDFFGDEFDKLYTKFYARERGVDFEFNYSSLQQNYYRSIIKQLEYNYAIASKYNCIYGISRHNNIKINESIDYLLQNKEELDVEFVYKTYNAIYPLVDNDFYSLKCLLIINDTELYLHFFFPNAIDAKKIEDYFNAFNERIQDYDKVQLQDITKETYNSLKRESLDLRITSSDNEKLIAKIIDYHSLHYAFSYFTENGSLAYEHCKSILYSYSNYENQYLAGDTYINMAYIFLVNRDLIAAEKSLEIANSKDLSPSSNALLNYNIGIYKIMNNEYCLPAMKLAKELASDKGFDYSCLLVPDIINEEEIVFNEVNEDLNFESIIDDVISKFENIK
jgi:hypothetical protein